jgi:hypothetical protein
MGDAIPVMNMINAPVELCQQAQERFLQFLNNFLLTEYDGELPSQSNTHSQGSGVLLSVRGVLCPCHPTENACRQRWRARAGHPEQAVSNLPPPLSQGRGRARPCASMWSSWPQ